jgi:hypothetical protein
MYGLELRGAGKHAHSTMGSRGKLGRRRRTALEGGRMATPVSP